MEKIMEHLKEAAKLIAAAPLDVDKKSAVHNAGVEVLVQLGTLEKVEPLPEAELMEKVLEENKSLREEIESLRILTGAETKDVPPATPGTETPDPENKEPQA